MLYIHGYLESATAKSGEAMTKALCTRNDLNKLVFDYARDASGLYPISVGNAMRVSVVNLCNSQNKFLLILIVDWKNIGQYHL